MTRVLMTADTVGGVWTYALELADAFAPHGVEVTLATMGRPLRPSQWQEVRASAVVDVHESTFALEWMQDPWADVDRAGEWLLEVEAAVRPDIVHLNGYCHGTLPWQAPTVVVAHSCVLSWWQAVLGAPAPAEWQEYQRRVAAGLAAAGSVVAPSAAMLGELGHWYGFAGGSVVPNCRRSDWVRPAASPERFVLSAGRVWDQAKNIAAVGRAAALAGLQWPVVVAGDASHPDGGERALPRVQVLGPLPFAELADHLNRAAVFALPARYEPFGLAALEAGLAGCALVLGDIPSLREVWGDAATFVEPDDEEALGATLTRLTSDPVACAAAGAAAQERARSYTPARTAAGYLAAYASLPMKSSRP